MSTHPKRWCQHDRCCEFEPGSHNSKFCPEHRCKRKAESARKRLTAPEPTDPEEIWRLQENRKLHRLEEAQTKNEWLLAKSSFGFFDIETFNLDANIGLMLCACIKDYKGGVRTFVANQVDGIVDDHQLVLDTRDYLESFDYICTYYGTGFDIPYINTRLIIHNERPIDRLRHVDLYYVARFALKLHSNRLAVVAETLFGESDKTRVVGPIWTRAVAGNKEALDYIIEHCVIDVEVLEKVFDRLRGFVNLSAKRWKKFGASY